jgi:hypothetical protein
VPTWTASPNGPVRALALDGSTVYLGGNFQTVNGDSRVGVAAVDGATGATLPWDGRLSGGASGTQVSALSSSAGGLYVGGDFLLANSVSRAHLAAFDVSSGAATGWNPGADGHVSALAASAGTIYAGGDFNTVGGATRHHAAAIDAVDATVGAWHPDPDGSVRAIAINGSVAYLGGTFANAGGAARTGAAAVAADPASDGDATAWHPDPSGFVQALAASGSTVYIGGSFVSAGGADHQNLAAVQAAGTGAAVPGWVADADSSVESLAADGGRLYVGGQFETITHSSASTRHYIAALNAADGSVQGWNPDADWEILSIVPAGTSVYVGGGFGTIGGADRLGLAQLDTSTGTASSWDPEASSIVRGLALDGAGALHAVGDFESVGDLTQTHYARFDQPTTTSPATTSTPGQDAPGSQPGTPTQQQPADTTPPRLTLGGRKTQAILRKRRVVLDVRTSEDATLTAGGRISIPGGGARVVKLGRAVRAARGGTKVKLSLAISKRARKAIAAARARGKRVTCTVRVVATDAAGNATTATRRITLK